MRKSHCILHLRSCMMALLLCCISFGALAEAGGLKKGLYSTLDGRNTIRVISSDELEIENGSDIIIASYSVDGETVRAVFTVFGTKTARYFEISSKGLRGRKRGVIYYSKRAKLAAIEKQRRAKQAAIEAQKRAKLAAAERQQRAKLAAIEQKKRAKLAAIEQKKRAKLAAIEQKKRAKLAAIEQKKRLIDEMVLIPSGSFRMGSNDGDHGERPVHTVHVNSFKMSKHEITQAQWQSVMGSNPSGFVGANRPVEKVSWVDIQTFIRNLNAQTGQSFRLPSEAEWEYAARAGSSSQFSWGDSIGRNKANCRGCGSQWDASKTAPVGSFQPNGFGLYDMRGNVREWVQDCGNPSYSGAPTDGSAWLSDACASRVVRGGSWYDSPAHLRSSDRTWYYSPETRSSQFGFRLAQN